MTERAAELKRAAFLEGSGGSSPGKSATSEAGVGSPVDDEGEEVTAGGSSRTRLSGCAGAMMLERTTVVILLRRRCAGPPEPWPEAAERGSGCRFSMGDTSLLRRWRPVNEFMASRRQAAEGIIELLSDRMARLVCLSCLSLVERLSLSAASHKYLCASALTA